MPESCAVKRDISFEAAAMRCRRPGYQKVGALAGLASTLGTPLEPYHRTSRDFDTFS